MNLRPVSLVRSRVRAACWLVAAVVLAFSAAPRMASAQNTIPQTTCGGVNNISSCLTNGFLQDLAVDCSGGAGAPFVATALAQITDRNGPNRIRVSGTCGLFIIVGFNRLTIEGSGGAKITQAANIVNSRNVVLKSLTFDQQPGFNLTVNGSQVLVDGVTVKNVTNNDAAVVLQASTLDFTGAASLVTNNACNGIDVGAGSHINVTNVTISNNGFQQGCGGQRNGIKAHNGGSVNLSNQMNINGTFVDAPVDISGNRGNGITAGSVTTSGEGGNAWVRIHDNGGVGLELGNGSSDIEGNVRIDSNNNAQIAVFGGFLGIGGGAQVEGVGGISAGFNAFVLLGSGGPMTLTGGVYLAGASTAVLGERNTIDTLTCDTTSSILNADSQSIIGRNACQKSQASAGFFSTDVRPSATTVAPGGVMTFTVINGPGNVLDWLGLFCPPTAANSAYIDWKRMSNTRVAPQTSMTSATITFTMPITAGTTCNVRLLSNDSFTAVATSATVTVDATVITPSATTVASGDKMTFTLVNGQGNVLDWVGLYCPSTPFGTNGYVDWKRLSDTRVPPPIGLTGATITFIAPSPGSTCNVRAFSNDTFAAMATSATVTVQ